MEWDKRVSQGYGVGKFNEWVKANPVTPKGNDDG
jgi:hypothetical protein